MIAAGLLPLTMALVADSPPGAAVMSAGLIDTIDFSAMTAYASSWEATSLQNFPESSQLVLTDPAITAQVKTLREWLLDRWLHGESAVNKEQLYTAAVTLVSDPGTALILCYHVCQMFARGFATVLWQRVADWMFGGGEVPADAILLPNGGAVDIDDYTDGFLFYRPVETNAALSGEVLLVNGRDTIFYLLFDKSDELGVRDPGDWYQFFLMSGIAYYAATERITDEASENPRAQVVTALVRSTLRGMQHVGRMPEVSITSMDSYDAAWMWGNALSFVEGGMYGASDVIPESDVHRMGCLYGLALAGHTYHPDHLHWWVPSPNELAENFGLYLAQYHSDVNEIRTADDKEEAFWDLLAAIGTNDPGIQGFLELLRSQGPSSRADCVLDGVTGTVLPSHPVAGSL
jgi:hypothetical protein